MHPLVSFVRAELERAADPAKAEPMSAYMKRVQPFHGVPTPARTRIVREARARFAVGSREEYDAIVRDLWSGPLREEKYAALDLAHQLRAYHTREALPLLQELLSQCDWWDVLDSLAVTLLGRPLKGSEELPPLARAWNASDHLWTRRAAILVQLSYKRDTNEALLEGVLAARLHEREFFIRKAIGWALREYAKTNPAWVLDFVARHEAEISPLSKREALKHLKSP